jgi:hypothetical protein
MNRVKVTIDETTSLAVAVEFLDESGALTFPEVATFRLDDEASGAALIPSTILTPAERVTVEIPRSANAVLDRSHVTENKVLTVDWTYGAGQKGGKSEFVYAVRRLDFA